MRRNGILAAAILAVCFSSPPALPCSLCGAKGSTSLRENALRAKVILYGTLANARLTVDAGGLARTGVTDLEVEATLKSDPAVAGKKVVEVPRYLPVDPKTPTRYLLFCDLAAGKLDPLVGIGVDSPAVVDYLRGALAIDSKDRTETLLYYFRFLDHPDPVVAGDAFQEWAKATDREVGAAGPRLPPAKLRAWLTDPRTPADRLGLFAFLLGSCGGDEDAALLRSWVDRPTERTSGALGGALGGYIQLRAADGWALVRAQLTNPARPYAERLAVLGTLRFYHDWKGDEVKAELLGALRPLLALPDFADLAVEDLRRWQLWDLTDDVLAQYGKPTHAAPIVQRALVRYALSCPRLEAARFVAALRQSDASLVGEIEESLRFEKGK